MKIFVGNRITEIHDISLPEQWAHVDGLLNPADLLTRGVMDPEKLMSNRWFESAEFLEEDEIYWTKTEVDELDPDNEEVKKKPVLVALGIVSGDDEYINVSRFSNWMRLKRSLGWTIRFTSNCRSYERDRELGESLTVDEVELAETVILKDVQHASFSDEVRLINAGKPLPPSSPLSSLCPVLDGDGLLRVGGRLRKIDCISTEAKHPAILPRTHPVTKLLIDWTHRRNGHVGPEHVLSILRESYWVISGRTAINQVVGNCFFCRIRKARRKFPFMADLPPCRAAVDLPPFCNCGVDLFGPIEVKQGRKRLKRWVVLFTCLTIRCIHLEVVENCETDAFINSLRRFVNRRGCPTKMFSDNGTNFRGASAELKEVINGLDKVAIADFATNMKIVWDFNPPKAPHMGGCWERMVRSVKEVLFGLMKDHVVTDPQLLTGLTEAESIVNSRPLTHLPSDVSDLEALTPNHILLGKHRNWASLEDTSASDISSRRQWRQVQGLRKQFWSR